MLPRTARAVEAYHFADGLAPRPRLANDPPQLGLPSLERRALFGPELVLVVDGVGDAAGAFDVIEQPDPDVLRDTEAGKIGADRAA